MSKLSLLLCAIVFLFGCTLNESGYPQAQSLEAAVQGVLAKQGYYQGPIDGTIGPSTSQAIRNYQRDHKLTPTGTINPALTTSMRLSGPEYTTAIYPSYTYPAYVPWYAGLRYNQPTIIGLGGQNCQPYRGRYNNYAPPYRGFHHAYNEARRCW